MKKTIKLAVFVFFIFGAKSAHCAAIYEYKGWVEVKAVNAQAWTRVTASGSVKLSQGDQVATKRASMAVISMDDGSKVTLAPHSMLTIAMETPQEARLDLGIGKVRSLVKKLHRRFAVKTPTAVCAVRGTDFGVAAAPDGSTRVEVYEGNVLASDASGNSVSLMPGQFTEIHGGEAPAAPGNNFTPMPMDTALDAKSAAMREIYTEISKESIIAQAQQEIQQSEYQNRKVALDSSGNRVRMEEYIIRPAPEQFKYVVLNQREGRFDFGKILFIFNKELPQDLTQATKTMLSASGDTAPEWYLTDLSSVMSNTIDKVVEEASGGHMVADNPSAPSSWNLFFSNYAFYVQGGNEPSENSGKGKLLWAFADNGDNIASAGEFTYLGGVSPVAATWWPNGSNVFHTSMQNTYADGTWIKVDDFITFDDGTIAGPSDFAARATPSMTSVIDRLNFERVYNSSLFAGRKIDLIFSAKLLHDAGMLRLAE